jgi:hypothetical protein
MSEETMVILGDLHPDHLESTKASLLEFLVRADGILAELVTLVERFERPGDADNDEDVVTMRVWDAFNHAQSKLGTVELLLFKQGKR